MTVENNPLRQKLKMKEGTGMAEIHSIDEAKPHTAGPAVCLSCKHEWTAVIVVGVDDVECPECGMHKGVRKGLIYPTPFWACACGCSHFQINDELQPVCVLCGTAQVFD